MAEFPSLNLWTDAYLSDTRHLSTLEHGAYLLLIMEAWRRPHCDLPDDDRMLGRLAGVRPDEWEEMRPIIMAFWTLDGRSKTWKQKRLTKERDAAKKRSKSQADKAAKRWNKTKTSDATASAGECPDDASITTAITTVVDEEADASPSTARKARRSSKKTEPFVRPDWVPEEPWDAFVAMRATNRNPMTDHAKRLAVGELAKLATDGHPPGPVLNQSTFRGWQGLFPLKDQDHGNQGSGNRNGAPGHRGGRDNRDGIERALDRQGYGSGPTGRSGAGEGGSSGELPFARPAPVR